MLTWDCGRDQQGEQTLNRKCEALKLVIAVRSCPLVKFSTKRFNARILAQLVENFNSMTIYTQKEDKM